MCEASAQHRRQGSLNLFVACFWVFIKEGFCGQDHPAETESTLRGLLLDEDSLNRVRTIRSTQPFQSGYVRIVHWPHGSDAGADCLTSRNHRECSRYHSPAWWRRLFDDSEIVKVIECAELEDGPAMWEDKLAYDLEKSGWKEEVIESLRWKIDQILHGRAHTPRFTFFVAAMEKL